MRRTTLLGASGLVGTELLKLLKSIKVTPFIPGRDELIDLSFRKDEVVLSSLPNGETKKILPRALEQGAQVIDLSSAYRMDEGFSLIVPEINGELLESSPNAISSPNCVATLLSLVLSPLHKAYTMKRAVVTTYQAASGAGKRGLLALEGNPSTPFPHPIKNNVFPHESPHGSDIYCTEEEKIIDETKCLLEAPHTKIHVRSVRVPVVRAHTLSVNVTFETDPVEALEILTRAKGISYHDEPTPLFASGKKEVFFGPIRHDPTLENTLDLWIVGDQLLKGAAYNAFQIYTELTQVMTLTR